MPSQLFKRGLKFEDDGRAIVGSQVQGHEFAKKTFTGGTNKDGIISNMWDNNNSTSLRMYSNADADEDHIVLFDLGQVYTVKSIYLATKIATGGTSTIDYNIQYSTDNSTWTDIRDVDGFTAGTSSVYIDSDGNFRARYIRLYFNHTGGTNNGAGTTDDLYIYESQILI